MTLRLKNHLLLTVATILSLVVFLVFTNLIMSWSVFFASPDAHTYFDVVEYFRSGAVKHGLEIRPFFYPLIILLCIKTGGIWMLWIVQLVLWAAAAQLIFATISRVTKSWLLAWTGALIYLCNYSILAATYTALSEVITVFGLAFLGYYLLAKERKNLLRYGAGIVLIFSVLTVIKPVFTILLYVSIIGFLIAFRKELLKKLKPWLLLAGALIPFFIQLAIFKANFGEWNVSEISNITLNEYLYAQGIAKIEGSDYVAIRKKTWKREQQRTSYMLDHADVFAGVFMQNLDDNLNGDPTFLKYPPRYQSPKLYQYMEKVNKQIVTIHHLFFYMFCVFVVYVLVKKRLKFYLPLLALYGVVFYYIFVTGISAFQGDRLTLPVIGLWPVVYTILLHAIFRESLRKSVLSSE